MKETVIPIVIGTLGTIPKGLIKRGERLWKKRTSGDHPDYSIIKNTYKSSGDLRRLAVTPTPVENHRLTLAWKTLKWSKIIITCFYTYSFMFSNQIPIKFSNQSNTNQIVKSIKYQSNFQINQIPIKFSNSFIGRSNWWFFRVEWQRVFLCLPNFPKYPGWF